VRWALLDDRQTVKKGIKQQDQLRASIAHNKKSPSKDKGGCWWKKIRPRRGGGEECTDIQVNLK